jgi:hypothetical protein
MSEQRPSWPILIEAGIAILAASVVIRLVPFKRLASHLGSHCRGYPAADPGQVNEVVRAIRAWAVRLPWRTLCFEQGLSAYWMLRRRRLAVTLFYGAATIEGELKAHVWVRSGSRDVVGCENASDYALLAQFPPDLS